MLGEMFLELITNKDRHPLRTCLTGLSACTHVRIPDSQAGTPVKEISYCSFSLLAARPLRGVYIWVLDARFVARFCSSLVHKLYSRSAPDVIFG